jgi:hypothetical protein
VRLLVRKESGCDLQDFEFSNLSEEEMMMPAASVFTKKTHSKNSLAGSGGAVNPFFASANPPPPPSRFCLFSRLSHFGFQIKFIITSPKSKDLL